MGDIPGNQTWFEGKFPTYRWFSNQRPPSSSGISHYYVWLPDGYICIFLVGGFKHLLFFHNILDNASQLTNIFQDGWNHQPDSDSVTGIHHVCPILTLQPAARRPENEVWDICSPRLLAGSRVCPPPAPAPPRVLQIFAVTSNGFHPSMMDFCRFLK